MYEIFLYKIFFLYLSSLATTPSLELDPEDGTQRRGSSGTLMSPEVDNGLESDDGFYLLKKDSQRRTTLAKVLAQDGNKICELWMQKIRDKYLGETVLTTKHLIRLMQGLKDYLTEQSLSVIEAAVRQLKEELDFDVTAINQLQFAIYLYQESVNEVLRHHPIKPHWMFALDNLVRSGVQAAITVLSPELGENLANNSSPSTVSGKSSKSSESFDVRDQVVQYKTETTQLLQELLDCQKIYLGLVRQLIDNTQQQSEALRQLLSSKCPEKEEVQIDQRLALWLQGLGLHESAQKIFLNEGYTLDEVLYEISRDDLHRVGLRGASEFRIWRAIIQHRERSSPLCNGSLSDTI